ncbi:hypothetical protein [Desulfoluna butyratoxydans]|nr:hypothetical protein [Desulfoluna butyratoxydans]
MKRVYVLVGMMACLLVLGGCTGATAPATHPPAWILNPSDGGAMAGVGSCRPHLNGYSAQRKQAIRRALDEIAMQKGTTISNVSLVGTTGTRAGTSTSMESWSFQTVDNQTVTAVVRASWKDPVTEELFVWVVSK